MEVVSARDFRCKQTAFLTKAKQGEDILLTSRVGTFKIVPVTREESLERRACRWMEQVQLIQEGKLETKPIADLFDEL